MTLDLRGVQQNAYHLYSSNLTEDMCLESSKLKKEYVYLSTISLKKKFVAFYFGDMDTAREMYFLRKELPAFLYTGGEFV